MSLIILFAVLNAVNVVLQTAKSLVTIKCGKMAAAIINAVAYGVYTVVIVYTVSDIDLWTKVIVVAAVNFFGVYLVKLVEERNRKDKLWKIEVTLPASQFWGEEGAKAKLDAMTVSHNYEELGTKYVVINFYSENSAQSEQVRGFVREVGAKYFVHENRWNFN